MRWQQSAFRSPSSRFTPENQAMMIQCALDAARAIQLELGFPCPRSQQSEIDANIPQSAQIQEMDYAE